MTKSYYLSVVLGVLVFLLFGSILNLYFTGDDFFHFTVSQTDGSPVSFIRLFGFYPFSARGIAFYRPVFREALYNIYYSLFGLNQIPFRLTQFVLHFINTYLVFIFFQKYFGKYFLSYLTALFFAVSTPNLVILSYLAGGIQAQGATLFLLLTLILFSSKKYSLAFLSFILSISSHELGAVAPLILILISNKKDYLKLLPYFIALAVYGYFNLFVIGFSQGESQYAFSLSPKSTINTIMWYSAWAYGLPEMLIDFVRPGFSLDPRLMQNWGSYYRIIFPSFFISISALAVMFITNLVKDVKNYLNKKFLSLLAIFIISLLPVLFLPTHKQTYYLATGLFAFWGAKAYTVYKFNTLPGKKLVYLIEVIFFISFSIMTITSIAIGKKTYWAFQRGKIAEKLINNLKTEYPTLVHDSIIYYKNDPDYPILSGGWGGSSTQAKFILSGSDAIRLLYKDPTLNVLYEDFDELPQDGNVIIVTSKILD